MNGKIYVLVGILTAALLYAIEFFDKNEAAVNWLTTQGEYAANAGMGQAVSGLIVKPVIFMINGPIGAVLGGILWPVVLVWLLLLVCLLTFSILSPGFRQAGCSVSINC